MISQVNSENELDYENDFLKMWLYAHESSKLIQPFLVVVPQAYQGMPKVIQNNESTIFQE